MAISPQGQLYKFATEYAFDPSRAFTKTPELDIAEKIPFPMTGIDFATGKQVNLAAPKEEKDQGSVFGKESPLAPWQQAMEWNPFLDYQREKNLAYEQAVSNLEAQQQLGLIQQLYPTISKAAQEATARNLAASLTYEQQSPRVKQQQEYMAGKKFSDEATAIANQAQAAALLGGSNRGYTGKNVRV
jgi:hypothetical protein